MFNQLENGFVVDTKYLDETNRLLLSNFMPQSVSTTVPNLLQLYTEKQLENAVQDVPQFSSYTHHALQSDIELPELYSPLGFEVVSVPSSFTM